MHHATPRAWKKKYKNNTRGNSIIEKIGWIGDALEDSLLGLRRQDTDGQLLFLLCIPPLQIGTHKLLPFETHAKNIKITCEKGYLIREKDRMEKRCPKVN